MTHEVKWCKDSHRDHKESWGAQARGLGGLESHELVDLQVSNPHLEDIKFHGSFAVFWTMKRERNHIEMEINNAWVANILPLL